MIRISRPSLPRSFRIYCVEYLLPIYQNIVCAQKIRPGQTRDLDYHYSISQMYQIKCIY